MKKRYILAFILVLCLSAGLNAQESLDQIKNKIKQINEQWENYLKAGNTQAVADLYADDAYSLPQNSKIRRGKDAIREQFDEDNKNSKVLDAKFSTVDVLGHNGMYVEIGNYKLSLQMKGMSKPSDDEGKYVTVWKTMPDGSLKVMVDAFSTDLDMKEYQSAMMPDQSKDADVTGGNKDNK